MSVARLNGADFVALFRAIAQMIEREKDHLSALDGVIGDGDHGVTMSIGFQAVDKALADQGPDRTPADICMLAAKTFLNAVGASVGPLYATALMRAGAAVKGKSDVGAEDVADIIAAMADGIVHRGKAEPGQKTMVDAWHPAAEAALGAKAGGSLKDITAAAADASRAGAEATASLVAGKGRSANLGDRAVGHIDPGAASAAMILDTIAQWASERAD